MKGSNLNRFWADLIVDELVRSGVDMFCLAPGSRSTPLTMAVAAHPKARHVMHFDERGTAFCALGYGRARGRPAAWITTSGTAVANGLPAVVEAATDGVPLLLITADRPPELRDTGANQTIDQVKLFGAYVRWQFDLPVPTTEVDPAMVLTTVDQAVYRAQRTPRGPVHLNCMFREPLAPDPDDPGNDGAPVPRRRDLRPFTTYTPTRAAVDPDAIEQLWASLRDVERGIVVAGRLDSFAQADAVRWLADVLGWPLLPDVTSQLRLGRAGYAETRVGYYDLILADEAFRDGVRPDAVLHVGGRSTSKRLMHFLQQVQPHPYVVVRDDPARLDPNHQVTLRVEADVISFCRHLAERVQAEADRPPPGAWRDVWKAASGAAGRHLDAFFAQQTTLSEPLVARCISRTIPEGHGLCLASSMPVRDMDMFALLDGAPAFVAANRGASGIDGTIATAAGLVLGLEGPVTLVVGDLALLYDLNSLALLRQLPAPLVVVAVNNHGGGIFSFLPVARHADVFEPFFGTPHDLDFASAAGLFGIDYARPQTPEALEEVYRAACRRATSTLIEVTTDRAENHALHVRLLDEVRAALAREAFPG